MSDDITYHRHRFARRLHWLVACLLPVQLALGFVAERVASRQIANEALAWHVQLGLVLLGVMLVRVGWRLLHRLPPAEYITGRWKRSAARVVHCALYVLLLVLPITGYVIAVWMGEGTRLFGLVDMPHLFTPPADDETGRAIAWYVHVYGAWMLIGLVGVHVAAAVWHRAASRRARSSRRVGSPASRCVD